MRVSNDPHNILLHRRERIGVSVCVVVRGGVGETGYERMKRLTEESKQVWQKHLKGLAENYHNDPDHIAKCAFNNGLACAIKEVEGWENLERKIFAELPFANPKEAEREHGNTMRLLAVIKSKLEKACL